MATKRHWIWAGSRRPARLFTSYRDQPGKLPLSTRRYIFLFSQEKPVIQYVLLNFHSVPSQHSASCPWFDTYQCFHYGIKFNRPYSYMIFHPHDHHRARCASHEAWPALAVVSFMSTVRAPQHNLCASVWMLIPTFRFDSSLHWNYCYNSNKAMDNEHLENRSTPEVMKKLAMCENL